jgi:glycerate kinase
LSVRRVVVAPASLKGVLSAPEAAAALAAGVRQVDGVAAEEVPVADGGEGTAAVVASVRGGTWHAITVADPLGRRVQARFLLLADGTAVLDCAEAVGLGLLAPAERDPLRATSHGLGELLLAALDAGGTSLLVGLGGSATVDGGVGLRSVVGDRLRGMRVQVACDVRNPLLGERGAARAFGPQKGATPEQVELLERRLAGLAELRPYADLPGAGAAGGLGAAFAALGASLVAGGPLVLELLGLEQRLRGAALVVTGEGTVDATTAEGKAPGAVASAACAAGLPCVVFGGRVLDPLAGAHTVSLSGDPAHAARDLRVLGRSLGERVMREGARG